MSLPLNEHSLFILTKNEGPIFDVYARKFCKILKFTPEWTFDEILDEISKINQKLYSYLCVIMIGHENFELSVANGNDKRLRLDTAVSIFQKSLRNFICSRSIYLQLTTMHEREPKLYCRYEDMEEFYEMESSDFVGAIDAEILTFMIENDKTLNSPQKLVETIYEKLSTNPLKTENLIQNFKASKFWEELNESIDEDEAGPSTRITPTRSSKVNGFKGLKFKNSPLDAKIPEQNLKDYKFVVIGKNFDSIQNWTSNNITKKLREMNPEMWLSCVDLKVLQEEFKAENSEIDFERLLADHISKKTSNFEAEIFQKLYKNGKICIVFSGFEESDPNCVEFLEKLCKTFEKNERNQLWLAVKDIFEGNSGDQLGLEVVFHLNDTNNIEPEIAEHKLSTFHSTLRNSIDKNFETSEMLNILNSRDNKIDNLIFINFISTLQLTKELTIEKFPKILDNFDLTKNFEIMSEDSETILHILVKNCQADNLKFTWNKLEAFAGSKERFKKFLEHRTLENHENLLHFVSKCDDILVHKNLWNLLVQTFGNRLELLDFIMQRNKFNNNFIHCIALHGNSDTFEHTLEKLKEIFTSDQYQEIIESKGQQNRNLFQLLTVEIKEIKIFNDIWKLFRTSMNTKQFVKLIQELDINGQNVFHLAAGHSTVEIFKFIYYELSRKTSQDFTGGITCEPDSNGCNLLQIATVKMQSLQFLKDFSEYIKIYCAESDFWMMLKNVDKVGDNVLCKAIKLHSREFIEFLWTEIKAFLLRNDALFEYSNLNEVSNKDWIQIAAEFNPSVLKFCEEMQSEHMAIALAMGMSQDVNMQDIIILDDMTIQSAMPQLVDLPQAIDEILEIVPVALNIEQPPVLYISNPNCKIIKFTYFDILPKLEDLMPQIYPNLFMVIVEDENFDCSDVTIKADWESDEIAALKVTLANFKHLIFMKLKSIDENESKYFFKGENENEFLELDVVEFVDKLDAQKLIILAEYEEMLMSSETIIEDKFLRIFYQKKKFLKSCKFDGSEASFEDIEMIDLEDKNHQIEETLETSKNTVPTSRDINQANFNNLPQLQNLPINSIVNGTKNAKSKELLEDELFEDVKNHKFVIISGKASSGKSWFLKNAKNKFQQTNATVYPVYFELRQFSEELQQQFGDFTFENFISNYIVSHFTKFESEIFNKLYKTGKVCICFDGFDELAPECADNFLKICQKFQPNGGNQLWITINDNIEQRLMEDLEIENVYKLDEFQADQACDMTEECRKILLVEIGKRKPLKYHQNLWKIVQKFLNLSDLFELINHTEYDEENLIFKVTESNSKEIVALAVSEINKILTKISEDAFLNYLQHVNKHSETIFHLIVKQGDPQRLELFYEAIKTFLTPQQLVAILSQQTTTKHENILQLAAKSVNLEFHETIWKTLSNAFEDRQNLMQLILQKNRFGDNFVHYLIVYDRPDITDFTLNKLKENFEPTQYEEILKSKGYLGRNLLQAAAVSAKNIKTHNILWNSFIKISESAEEFVKHLQEVDDNGNNIFHLAACFTTRGVFEFMILELKSLISQNEIKKIISTLGLAGKNILQSAARQNYSIEFHKVLWETIWKHLGIFEVWGMIKHVDQFGDNILADVIECNNLEVVEFTWEQIKKFLDRSDIDCRDLNFERFGGLDLPQLASQNTTDSDVYEFCNKLLTYYNSLIKMSDEPIKVASTEASQTSTNNFSGKQQKKKSRPGIINEWRY